MDCLLKTFPMKRTILIIVVLLLLCAGGWFWTARKNAPENAPKESTSEARPIDVTVKKASDLTTLVSEERLPGVIVPENETIVTARISGTVSSVSFDVGKPLTLGQVLVRIDDPIGSVISKSGIQSESVRQAEIAASLARKTYKDANRLAENNKTKSKANNLARDLAKLRLESAEIDLENTTNNALVRSPLSGIVTEKSVDIGSAVAPGTAIATIASGGAPKARFQISENTARVLANGNSISILLHNGNEEQGTITSISKIADTSTGKFSVEASLEGKSESVGTVATVIVRTQASSTETSTLVLPLSAITTGQDGSFFFIVKDGAAKKIAVTSLSVSGETATVSADIPKDADVIIESLGTLEDGTQVNKKER